MDIHQLEAFLKIVEEQSFTRAANELHLKQPSISKRIRTLEVAIGFPLFYRKQGKIGLSPEGEVFLPYAKEMMQGFKSSMAAIQAMNKTKQRIHFGTTSNLGTFVLPNIISLLYYKKPSIKLEVQTARSGALMDMLLNHKIDAAIITEPQAHPHLHCVPVMNDPIVCIASPHRSISRFAEINSKMLAEEQIIVYDPKFSFWSPLHDEFQRRNIRLHISLQLDRAESIKQLVKSGVGLSFLPLSCVDHEITSGELVEMRLTDFQLPTKLISLVMMKQNTNPLIKNLISAANQFTLLRKKA